MIRITTIAFILLLFAPLNSDAKSLNSIKKDCDRYSEKFANKLSDLTKGLHKNPEKTYARYQKIFKDKIKYLLKQGEHLYEIGKSNNPNRKEALFLAESIYLEILNYNKAHFTVLIAEEADWYKKRDMGLIQWNFEKDLEDMTGWYLHGTKDALHTFYIKNLWLHTIIWPVGGVMSAYLGGRQLYKIGWNSLVHLLYFFKGVDPTIQDSGKYYSKDNIVEPFAIRKAQEMLERVKQAKKSWFPLN